MVTKLDRKPDTLAREFENLAYVYSRVPELVPRPLTFGRWEQYWALWIEGIAGVPFGNSTGSLGTVVDTLLSFHCAVRGRHCQREHSRYHRMVQDPLENAARCASSAVRRGCGRLLRRIDANSLDSLPVIPQHGDFYPANVTLFRGQLRVLDWETFGTVDLPLYDLVTFLVSLLISTKSPFPALNGIVCRDLPAAVERYADGIGLTDEDIEILLPLSLVNWRRLMELDGREKFVTRMDGLIEHYFEHPGIWHTIFLPGSRAHFKATSPAAAVSGCA